MRKPLTLVLLTLVATAVLPRALGTVQEEGQAPAAREFDRLAATLALDRAVKGWKGRGPGVGGVLALVIDGDVVHSSGTGTVDSSGAVPWSVDTLWPSPEGAADVVRSIGRSLAAAGRIDLARPIPEIEGLGESRPTFGQLVNRTVSHRSLATTLHFRNRGEEAELALEDALWFIASNPVTRISRTDDGDPKPLALPSLESSWVLLLALEAALGDDFAPAMERHLREDLGLPTAIFEGRAANEPVDDRGWPGRTGRDRGQREEGPPRLSVLDGTPVLWVSAQDLAVSALPSLGQEIAPGKTAYGRPSRAVALRLEGHPELVVYVGNHDRVKGAAVATAVLDAGHGDRAGKRTAAVAIGLGPNVDEGAPEGWSERVEAGTYSVPGLDLELEISLDPLDGFGERRAPFAVSIGGGESAPCRAVRQLGHRPRPPEATATATTRPRGAAPGEPSRFAVTLTFEEAPDGTFVPRTVRLGDPTNRVWSGHLPVVVRD